MLAKRIKKKFLNLNFGGILLFTLIVLSHLHSSEAERKLEIQITEDEHETAVSELSSKDYQKLPPLTEKAKVKWTKLTFSLPRRVTHPPPPWLLPENEKPQKNEQGLLIPEKLKSKDEKEKEEDFRKKIAEVAETFLKENKTLVEINGKNFRIDRDCAQFVRAVYYYATERKTDLFYEALASGAVDKKSMSGVELLNDFFEKKLNYSKRNPRLGDVVIFDNTWDKNHNQKRDDNLTHVGVVTGFTEEGTIVFIHGNASRAIKRGYVNFNYPHLTEKNGKPYNSYGRVKYVWDKDDKGRLNSALVRAFGGY